MLNRTSFLSIGESRPRPAGGTSSFPRRPMGPFDRSASMNTPGCSMESPWPDAASTNSSPGQSPMCPNSQSEKSDRNARFG